MTKLNIFIENAYDEYEIDEVSVYNNTVKMADAVFSDKNLIKNSCLSNHKFKSVCFDIVLVNNEDIRRINREYRNKDAHTDVITFAVFADSPADEQFIIDGDINLGEIIISLDRIEEQALENKVSFRDELYFIISHGMLHLLGFDHQTEEDYNFMVSYQKKVKALVLN